MSTRQLHIDMAAGIMLSWMILGHIASHASYNGAFFCIGPYLSFFMLWFFYKAGMFYQDRKETIKERVHRGGQKLLRPFVIYSLIGQAIYYLCLAVENNVTFRSFVYQPIRSLFVSECVAGNGALWFLVVLFTINVFAPYIIGKLHPILIAIWGGVSCLYMLPVWYFVVSTNNPSFLRRNGFFFFRIYVARQRETKDCFHYGSDRIYIILPDWLPKYGFPSKFSGKPFGVRAVFFRIRCRNNHPKQPLPLDFTSSEFQYI